MGKSLSLKEIMGAVAGGIAGAVLGLLLTGASLDHGERYNSNKEAIAQLERTPEVQRYKELTTSQKNTDRGFYISLALATAGVLTGRMIGRRYEG